MEAKKENQLYKSVSLDVQLKGGPQISLASERAFVLNGLGDLRYTKFKPEDINLIMKHTITQFQQSQTILDEVSKRLKLDKQSINREDIRSLYDGEPNSNIISIITPRKKELLLGVKLQYTEPQELINLFNQTVKSMPDQFILPQPGTEELNIQFRRSNDYPTINIPSRVSSRLEEEIKHYNKLIVKIPLFQKIVNDFNLPQEQYVAYLCLMKGDNDYETPANQLFKDKFKCESIQIQYYIKDIGKTTTAIFEFLDSPDFLITKVFDIFQEFPGMPQLFLPDSSMLDLTKGHKYIGCLNELYNNIILTVVVSSENH